jgi:hypothetical protein
MAETGWRAHPAPPTWTKVCAVAMYRNELGVQFNFPVTRVRGKHYLKSGFGQRVQVRPYEEVFDDPMRGRLTFVRSLSEDRETAAIKDINADVCLFSGPEFNKFVENDPEFREAFKRDFAGQPFHRLIYFSKFVSEELWRRTERLKENPA